MIGKTPETRNHGASTRGTAWCWALSNRAMGESQLPHCHLLPQTILSIPSSLWSELVHKLLLAWHPPQYWLLVLVLSRQPEFCPDCPNPIFTLTLPRIKPSASPALQDGPVTSLGFTLACSRYSSCLNWNLFFSLLIVFSSQTKDGGGSGSRGHWRKTLCLVF